MRIIMVILSVIWGILTISCIKDNDRCGDFEWDPVSGCIGPSMSTDSEKDAGVVPDVDGGDELDNDTSDSVPILGELCESDADCAVYNANYCNTAADDPFCTLKDCSNLPNGCPAEGYFCCVTIDPNWYPDHCMPPSVPMDLRPVLCSKIIE